MLIDHKVNDIVMYKNELYKIIWIDDSNTTNLLGIRNIVTNKTIVINFTESIIMKISEE